LPPLALRRWSPPSQPEFKFVSRSPGPSPPLARPSLDLGGVTRPLYPPNRSGEVNDSKNLKGPLEWLSAVNLFAPPIRDTAVLNLYWGIHGTSFLTGVSNATSATNGLSVEAMAGSSEDFKADTHCGVSKSSTPPVAAPPRLDSTVRIVVPKFPSHIFLHFRTCSVRR